MVVIGSNAVSYTHLNISSPGQAISPGRTDRYLAGRFRAAGHDKGMGIAAINVGPSHVDLVARKRPGVDRLAQKGQAPAFGRHLKGQLLRAEGRRPLQDVKAFDAA